jgi:pimeloyl-ACP methyl ester carboxylesterase
MVALREIDGPGGRTVRFWDEGSGPGLLILHSGLDDGSGYGRVARRLASGHRVIRLQRPSYRLDLPATPPCTAAAELGHVQALLGWLGQPVTLFGHSSGGAIALEALVAWPERFRAAILYEPAIGVPGLPLFDPACTATARAALARGRVGRALTVHLRDGVGLSPFYAWLLGVNVHVLPRYRRLIPRLVEDGAAAAALGDRTATYTHIDVPVLLLSSDLGPAGEDARMDALEQALPHVTRQRLRHLGHNANLYRPAVLARAIAGFTQAGAATT